MSMDGRLLHSKAWSNNNSLSSIRTQLARLTEEVERMQPEPDYRYPMHLLSDEELARFSAFLHGVGQRLNDLSLLSDEELDTLTL